TMASGTPLIASRCGGNPETVTDGETGFLFTPGMADELYDILKKVEIKQLWDMGQKGRELILKRHTLKLFGDKYKSLYENVLADPAHLHQID
ncbi:MAG: glycosyltransferase, partial [Spirochaetia bacterium]|nr:glycosyltransferase [Spirochaetia bacterium]